MISARPLFSNVIRNFTPSHTFIIQTNYKPEAPSEDNALWRRAIIVPFEAEFWPVPSKSHHKVIDLSLEEKLMQEAPGILSWLIKGSQRYLQNGLKIPQKVQSAVKSYREENNGIEIFIKEHCEKVPELSVKCSELREGIRDFCMKEGYSKPSFPEITQCLERHGFEKVRTSGCDRWSGIQIKQ